MINKEAYLSTPRRINTLVMRITSMIAFADQKMKINKLPDKIMFDRLQRIIVEELKKNNSIYPNPLDTLNYLRDLRNYTEFKIKNNLKKKESLNMVRAENINEIISKIAVYNNIKSADKVVLNITKEGAIFRYINKTAEDVVPTTDDTKKPTTDSTPITTETGNQTVDKTVKPEDNAKAAEIAQKVEAKVSDLDQKAAGINSVIDDLNKRMETDPINTLKGILNNSDPAIQKIEEIKPELDALAQDPEIAGLATETADATKEIAESDEFKESLQKDYGDKLKEVKPSETTKSEELKPGEVKPGEVKKEEQPSTGTPAEGIQPVDSNIQQPVTGTPVTPVTGIPKEQQPVTNPTATPAATPAVNNNQTGVTPVSNPAVNPAVSNPPIEEQKKNV